MSGVITFSCGTCGKEMRVPESAAGKSGKCKSCNTLILVPQPSSGGDLSRPKPQRGTPTVVRRSEIVERPEPEPYRPPPQQQVIQPQVNFQPVIQQVMINKETARGPGFLAVCSILCGALALMCCWIPFIGLLSLPIAGLGVFLGFVAILVALLSRGRVLVAFAGILFSFVAIGVSIMSTAAGTVAVAKGISDAEKMRLDIERRRKEQQKNDVPEQVSVVTAPAVSVIDKAVPEVFVAEEKQPDPEPTISQEEIAAKELEKRSSDAARKLKLAKDLLKKGGSKSGPLKFLKEICDKYSDTPSYDEAKQILDAEQPIK